MPEEGKSKIAALLSQFKQRREAAAKKAAEGAADGGGDGSWGNASGTGAPAANERTVTMALLDGEQSFGVGFDNKTLVVSKLQPGAAAARAGLVLGQSVSAVDGHPVSSLEDFAVRVRGRRQLTLTDPKMMEQAEWVVSELNRFPGKRARSAELLRQLQKDKRRFAALPGGGSAITALRTLGTSLTPAPFTMGPPPELWVTTAESAPVPPAQPPPPAFRCKACGGAGHWTADCPRPPSPERSASAGRSPSPGPRGATAGDRARSPSPDARGASPGAMPPGPQPAPDELCVAKRPGMRIGGQFDHPFGPPVLRALVPGGDLDLCGGRGMLGRLITRVDGEPVVTAEEVFHLSSPLEFAQLSFAPVGYIPPPPAASELARMTVSVPPGGRLGIDCDWKTLTVTSVVPGQPCAFAGVVPGMRLQEIAGQVVRTKEDAQAALQHVAGRTSELVMLVPVNPAGRRAGRGRSRSRSRRGGSDGRSRRRRRRSRSSSSRSRRRRSPSRSRSRSRSRRRRRRPSRRSGSRSRSRTRSENLRRRQTRSRRSRSRDRSRSREQRGRSRSRSQPRRRGGPSPRSEPAAPQRADRSPPPPPSRSAGDDGQLGPRGGTPPLPEGPAEGPDAPPPPPPSSPPPSPTDQTPGAAATPAAAGALVVPARSRLQLRPEPDPGIRPRGAPTVSAGVQMRVLEEKGDFVRVERVDDTSIAGWVKRVYVQDAGGASVTPPDRKRRRQRTATPGSEDEADIIKSAEALLRKRLVDEKVRLEKKAAGEKKAKRAAEEESSDGKPRKKEKKKAKKKKADSDEASGPVKKAKKKRADSDEASEPVKKAKKKRADSDGEASEPAKKAKKRKAESDDGLSEASGERRKRRRRKSEVEEGPKPKKKAKKKGGSASSSSAGGKRTKKHAKRKS